MPADDMETSGNRALRFKAIDARELSRIYPVHMVRDFPADELKPLGMLVACLRAGTCRCYGLYDGAELATYAAVLLDAPGAAGVLDYLATAPAFRGRGLGGEMLRRLRAELSDVAGLIIEYEAPADALSAADRDLRARREAFYLRNGARRTGIDLIVFGVHYRVGFLPCARDLPDPEVKRMQIAIYDRVNSWDYHFLDEL